MRPTTVIPLLGTLSTERESTCTRSLAEDAGNSRECRQQEVGSMLGIRKDRAHSCYRECGESHRMLSEGDQTRKGTCSRITIDVKFKPGLTDPGRRREAMAASSTWVVMAQLCALGEVH